MYRFRSAITSILLCGLLLLQVGFMHGQFPTAHWTHASPTAMGHMHESFGSANPQASPGCLENGLCCGVLDLEASIPPSDRALDWSLGVYVWTLIPAKVPQPPPKLHLEARIGTANFG